jgi:hypothetical protein
MDEDVKRTISSLLDGQSSMDVLEFSILLGAFSCSFMADTLTEAVDLWRAAAADGENILRGRFGIIMKEKEEEARCREAGVAGRVQ